MPFHDIHELAIRYGGEDPDDASDYCDSSEHFTDLCDYVATKLGYVGVTWGIVHDNYYGDDWEYFRCPELGSNHLVALLEEDSNVEYLRHGIIQQANWSLGVDNREKQVTQVRAVCISYHQGDDNIEVREHPVGQCDYLLYEHEIMKDRKIRIDVTYFMHVKCRDKEDMLDNRITDAIETALNEDRLIDSMHDEISYELDDEPTIEVKKDRLKWKDVPKTRKI